MAIKIGSSNVDIKMGETQVVKVYMGSTPIWEKNEPTWSCTVSGLGSQSPSSVTFTHQGTMPTFENLSQGGVNFIKIPTMYRKVVTVSGNQITSFTISSRKEDNDFHPYSVFIDESGNLLPYVLIAKDWMSTSITLDDARTQARNKGIGYQLYDWQFQKLWQDLIICKMQTINTNSGSGITTDVLGLSWGSTGSFLDGVSYQGSTHKWAISYKPSTYVNQATGSTMGYQLVSYASGGTSDREIKALGYDSNNEFFNYPVDTEYNRNYNTYYCDNFYFSTSTTHPVFCNVGAASALNGAFRCAVSDSWSNTYGIRLCYRPIGD